MKKLKLVYIDKETLKKFLDLNKIDYEFKEDMYMIQPIEKKLFDIHANFISKISSDNMIKILYDLIVCLNFEKEGILNTNWIRPKCKCIDLKIEVKK